MVKKKIAKRSSEPLRCQQCGKEFFPFTSSIAPKFCSCACYNESRKKNPVKHPRSKSRTRICKNCGATFGILSETAKFCSVKCYHEHMAKNRIVRKVACAVCGKEFTPWNGAGSTTRNQAKYCSHKCAGVGITKTKKRRKRPNNTPSTTKADNLWSKLVKKRAGERCEYCGKREVLNSHHIFSRSNYSTRWDLDNGVCLCVGHHVFGVLSFHKAPVEMLEWIKEQRGNDWYESLRRKAKDVSNSTRDILEESYNELLEKSKEFT